MRRVIIAALLVGCAAESEVGETPAGDDDDAVVVPDAGSEDAGVEPDVGEADVPVAPDTGPTIQPLGMVYEQNPIDSPALSEATLEHLTDEDHALIGQFANVQSCTQDPDGETVSLALGIGAALELVYCTPDHVSRPGDDGTYRHLTPPEEPGVHDDPFAEVMMYHHMQRIHDYFAERGLSDLDYPLNALVNVAVYVPLCEEWAAFGNALFTPLGTFEYGVEFDFGFDGPAIIFGQTSSKDFAYEADVIYHEYTHAMIGTGRLSGAYFDEHGINVEPAALNEAYADYFAASLAGESVIGSYALNASESLTLCGVPVGGGGDFARDLSEVRRCPDDLVGEVHADGEIFASALWAIREAIGAEKADEIFIDALVGFTNTTDFALATAATLASAELMLTSPELEAVEAVFEERGLVGCERRIPAEAVGARGIPVPFPGASSFGGGFAGYSPGLLQLGVDLPFGTRQLSLTVTAEGSAKLDAVIKPGAELVTYDPQGGAPYHDGWGSTGFEKLGDGKWRATFAGGCLSKGPWTVSLHNRGGSVSISSVVVTTSDVEPETPNFQCGD